MKELIPKDDYGVFADNHETARVDSLYVAEIFDREHKNILQAIKNLDCSEEFRRLNFQPSSYKNEQGKKQPCYYMTRDGFTFLVMGFTGKKAAQFKEAYIQRFNQMEQCIKTLTAIREDFHLITEQIKLVHENPKPYHFSNECNMINKLVTGMTTKQFRKAHSIRKNESIRHFLTPEQLSLMEKLQKLDYGLLVAVPDYEQRKQLLTQYVNQRKV